MNRSADLLDPERLQGIDRLVHEPARLLLMATLYVVKSADFVFLLRHTALTAGNIASHMTKLETAGYVDVEKTFVGKRPQTTFRLTSAGRRALKGYRRKLEAFLAELPV